MADGTFLRRIGRINVDQRNASYRCLVGHEISDLVEAPRMLTAVRILPTQSEGLKDGVSGAEVVR